MPREALHVLDRARLLEWVQHLVEEMASRDIHAVGGNDAGRATVTHGKRVLKDARDARRKPGMRMIVLQRAASSEQMPDTG
jgi:hypothetical protein